MIIPNLQKMDRICRVILAVVVTASVAAGESLSTADHPSLPMPEGQRDSSLGSLSPADQPEDIWSVLFHKAYRLQELQRWDEAALILEQLQEDPGPLEDYLSFFLATCLFRSGRPSQAEEQLWPVLQEMDSLLEGEARELLGQIYLQTDRPQLALETFRILAQDPSLKPKWNRLRLELGRAHQRLGQEEEAARLWAAIMEQDPSSAEAGEALQELRLLRRGELEREELLSAGWVRFHRGQLAEAVEEWDRYGRLSDRPESASEALYLTAKASFQAKRYPLSEERCRRLLEEFPHSRRANSARLLLARCAQGQGQVDLAGQLFEQFVADHPWSQLANEALRRLAELSERGNDLATAESRYWQLSQRYPRQSGAAEALWRAGLYAYLRGDDATALARLDTLRQVYPQSELAPGALYWGARALSRSGHSQMCQRRLESLIQEEGGGYYALLAEKSLGRGSPERTSPQPSDSAVFLGPAVSQSSLPNERLTRRLEKGTWLLAVGLLPRARQELSFVQTAARQNVDLLSELFRIYQRYDLSGDALRLAQQVRSDFPAWAPKPTLERYLFPLGQMETVTAQARAYGLDPLLVLAVIRVESLFDPLAVSPAGAQGLMQIMPATGGEIAGQLGVAGDSVASPFDAQWNICMGVYYLWQQHQRFGGQTELALAAYNAGPGQVSRWRRRLGQVEPELFVELMDFRETRRYVKKVLATRADYRRIWGDQE